MDPCQDFEMEGVRYWEKKSLLTIGWNLMCKHQDFPEREKGALPRTPLLSLGPLMLMLLIYVT